jgi:hypothetical protein
MRRFLTRSLVIALVGSAASSLVVGRAIADTQCQQVDPATGQCTVWVQVPGHPATPGGPGHQGPQDTGSGQACYWDPAKQHLSKPPAGPVPCSSSAGYWSNEHNCYVQPEKPQPPAGDPSWHGHKPKDGAVYGCYQPQTGILVYFWAPDPPPAAGAGPTPAEVAQLAVKQLDLSAINMGIAPKPGQGSIGLVGMPVWMWVRHPDPHTYGPATATASAGGISVTATARIVEITWDMGDGTQVVCKTTGTPYKLEYGRKESPDCGYTYKLSSAREPGQAYTVTATSSWVINWMGAGQTGTIRLDGLARSAQIRIGEAQVLVD